MRLRFVGYSRAGKIKFFDKKRVEDRQRKLSGKLPRLKSDDPHIIALAIVAKVKLLVSGDKDLHDDFKNHPSIKGKVYQNQKHKKLLTPDLCP